jgi:hypothetical protein
MFAADDIEDVAARLRAHGAELVGELAPYEDSYPPCYVRGPEGIIVALAEQLGQRPVVADPRPTRAIRRMDRERQREENQCNRTRSPRF